MKLIVTDTNWADEMDIWGFEVIPNDIIYQAQIKAITLGFIYTETIEVSVGSNEDVSFDKNFLNCFIIKDVIQDEVDKLIELFGSHTRGHCLFDKLVETTLDIIEEYDKETSLELSNIIYGE